MTETVRAAVYTRMSLVAMGDTTKVDDQERICRELCDARGWTVADARVHCDNNKSAWQRARKRPGWDAMLADVEAGRIDAIVVYHGDRLIRQPADLEQLLALADSKGIRLASPTGTRSLDSADDRFVLRIEAAQACRESDNTSRRRKAQYERWRREGRVRPGGRGGRAFGFGTDGVTVIPAEADALRAAAAAILAGESTGSVAASMTAAGLRTVTGGEWSHTSLRKTLARARYAGLMPDGESAAAWPAILDRETWERLRLALDARAAGFGAATNARRWLLSGIAACQCGTPLQATPSKGRNGAYTTGYACRGGCGGCGKVYRSAAHLDAYVSAAVLARLADERNPAAAAPAPEHAAEWKALHDERAEAGELLADFGASPGRARLLMARLDRIDARIGELREREAGDARSRLLAAHAGITREQWEALPLDARRALVAAAVTVTVLPASGRGPGFRQQDVRVERR